MATLVAGRDDFQDGDHLAVAVLDADAVGAAGIRVHLTFDDEPSPGRGRGDRQAADRFALAGTLRPAVDGEHVRDWGRGLLIREGHVARRQPAGVERAAQLDGPILVEVMEQTGVHASPVVNRHGYPPPRILRGDLPAFEGVPCRVRSMRSAADERVVLWTVPRPEPGACHCRPPPGGRARPGQSDRDRPALSSAERLDVARWYDPVEYEPDAPASGCPHQRARRASEWIPGPTRPSTRWRVGLV